MLKQLINYCDKCAEEQNYPKTDKIKGGCDLCRRIGLINQIENTAIIDLTNFNKETWSGGGFKVEQITPFPVGQRRETVHPNLTYKILTGRIVIYFDKHIIVLADTETGQQIQITF